MKKNLLSVIALLSLTSCTAATDSSSVVESIKESLTSNSSSVVESKATDETEPQEVSSSESQAEQESSSVTKKKTLADFEVPEGGYDGSDVTVNFYHTMGDSLQAELDLAIADFNAIYPNITITHTQIGGYDDVRDQVKTELSIGEGPSMAYCYPDHVALYNKTKRVVKLENLYNDTQTDEDGNLIVGMTKAQQDDFLPGYWAEGLQFGDGSMYTLPFSKSTEVMYYNKTFFEDNGLSVPDHWFSTGSDDKTSIEYVCSEIKKIDPSSIPLGYDSESNWFITMCEQLGSAYTSANDPHFKFNNSSNIEFLKKFREWYKNGWVTTQQIYQSYTSGLFTNQDKTTAKCYLCIGSSAGASYQFPGLDEAGNAYFEVGIASVPQDDPEEPKVISQGPSICIFNKGDAQEVLASWLFLRFLTTDVTFQASFSMASGYIPVIQSAFQNESYQKFLAKADGTTKSGTTALSALTCTTLADAYYTSPAFIGSSEARDQVGDLVVKILTEENIDDAGIAQAFADAVAACEASIK